MRMVVAGDASSFDDSGFKSLLAAQLTGVEATDITLTITSASVAVTASFAEPAGTPSGNIAALTALATNTTYASAVLRVTVQAADVPTTATIMAAPPGAPPVGIGATPPSSDPIQDGGPSAQTGSGSDDDSTTIIIVVVAVVVGLLLLGVVGLLFYRRTKTARSEETTTTKGIVMIESQQVDVSTEQPQIADTKI